jgi:hypothetical protein
MAMHEPTRPGTTHQAAGNRVAAFTVHDPRECGSADQMLQVRNARLAADAGLHPMAGRAGFLFGGLTAFATLVFVGGLIEAPFPATMQGATMLDAIQGLTWMIGVLYWLTLSELPPAGTLNVQLLMIALCAGAVDTVLGSEPVAFDARADGLLISVMPSAPYLWLYEGGHIEAVALFLLGGGIVARSSSRRSSSAASHSACARCRFPGATMRGLPDVAP